MRDTQKQLAALTEEQRQELLERILLQLRLCAGARRVG